MDFGKHLGKLGKIFKLSDGKLMTVLPPDENHFLNQLKEKGLRATLMLDSTTNFDEVKSYTKSVPVSQEKEETTQQVDLTKDQEVKIDLPSINSYNYNNQEYVKLQTPPLKNQIEGKQYFVLKSVAEELGYTFEDIDGQFENIPIIKNRDDFNKIRSTSYIEVTKDNELLFDKYEEDFDIELGPSEQIEDEIAPDLLLKDYILGDGFDFSTQTPDEILTYKNAADWFNYRSELANYPFIEEIYEDSELKSTFYSVLPGETEITPEGARLKSGYLSKEIFGTVDTWDEKTHLRNKEVKEKIFAGTHGYNPATDTLYKLSKPVKVDAAAKLYADHQGLFDSFLGVEKFYDYDKFVETHNKKTIDLPLVQDYYSLPDATPPLSRYNLQAQNELIESMQLDKNGQALVFDERLFNILPHLFVETASGLLMKNGFYINQGGEGVEIISYDYYDHLLQEELKNITQKIEDHRENKPEKPQEPSVKNQLSMEKYDEALEKYNDELYRYKLKLNKFKELIDSASKRMEEKATLSIETFNTNIEDIREVVENFNNYLNIAGRYHDEDIDTYTENYLEFAKDNVDKDDIAESQRRITGAYDFIELLRKDSLIMEKLYAMNLSPEELIEDVSTYGEPDLKFKIEEFIEDVSEYGESDLKSIIPKDVLEVYNIMTGPDITVTDAELLDFLELTNYMVLGVLDTSILDKHQKNENRKDFVKTYYPNVGRSSIFEDYKTRDEELLYLKYGKSYDENKALQILAQMYPDGFLINMDVSTYGEPDFKDVLIKIDDDLSQPDREAIIGTDKFKNLVKSLYKTKGYLEDKKSEIDKQMRSDKYLELLKYALNDEATKFSAEFFSEGKLIKNVRDDINVQLKHIGQKQFEVISKLDSVHKTHGELLKSLNDLKNEIDNFDLLAETNIIMEKYNIDPDSPGAMDMLRKNEFAVNEFNQMILAERSLINQKKLLETETIPTYEKLIREISKEYEDLLKTEDEYSLAKNIADRQHATGTYYAKKFGISVFDIFYGSVGAISSGMSRTLIELGGFEKGSIGYSLLTDIAEFGDWLGDDVDKKVQKWNNSLSLPTRWEDIDDAGSAVDYLFTGFTQNLPYVLMMIGSGGIGGIRGATGLMGTIAYADDFDQKYKMNKLWVESGGMYGQEFSFFEMFSSALVSGAAETFFERVSFGQLKGLGYFGETGPKSLKNAKKAMDKSIRKTCKIDVTEGGRLDLLSKALDYPKSFLDEGFSEFMTEFSNNLMDVMIGVEGANLTDGLDEAFINGAFLSSMLHSPSMFKTTLLDAFITKDTNKRLAQQSEKVKELLIKLNDTSMSKEQKAKIEEEIEQIGLDINEALSRDV